MVNSLSKKLVSIVHIGLLYEKLFLESQVMKQRDRYSMIHYIGARSGIDKLVQIPQLYSKIGVGLNSQSGKKSILIKKMWIDFIQSKVQKDFILHHRIALNFVLI